MAYTKQTWADLPSKTTPINATRLGHIEDGIFNAAQTADTAASTAGTAAANVGILSGKVATLEGQMYDVLDDLDDKVDKVAGKGLSTNDYDDTDKNKVDTLGTASTKNSTSVVTDSSDLVESGAVKDIVGWGNKNKLPNNAVNNSINGADFTVNADKSILVNTPVKTTGNVFYTIYDGIIPAGSYVLSGCPSGGSNSGYSIRTSSDARDYGEGASFTLAQPTNLTIRIVLGGGGNLVVTNKLFKPMIRLASVTDDTYEPYHPSVEQTLRDAEVIEGKNLFDPSIVNWSSYTYADGLAKNNITDTRDSFLLQIQGRKNGSYVKELIASLPITSVGNYEVEFTIGSSDDINQLNIGHNGGSNNIMFIYPFGLKGTYKLSFKATGVNPTVVNGIVLTDIMISVNGGAYEPYYVPIKDVVPNKCDNSVIGTVEDGTNPTKSYAVGENFTRNRKFCTCISPVTTSSTWTLNGNYIEGAIADKLNTLTDPFYPFNEYRGSATSLESLSHGMWMLTSTQMANILDKPSNYVSGRAYIIRTGSTDDNVLIVMNAQSKKIWIKFQYTTWSPWFTISMS